MLVRTNLVAVDSFPVRRSLAVGFRWFDAAFSLQNRVRCVRCQPRVCDNRAS